MLLLNMSTEVIALSLLTFFASIIGILAGFGSSTIMLPIVVLFYPLPIALLFVGVIHLFNDFWQVLFFFQAIKWKLLLTFGIPGIIASYIGASIIIEQDQTKILSFLGGILIAYVALLALRPTFRLPNNTISASTGGVLSGFMAGISGIGGPVRSMFLSAFSLPKKVYLFTAGAIAIMVDSTRLVVYYSGNARLPDNLLQSIVVFIIISLIGAEVGKKLVDKIPQQKFRSIVAAFLLVVGIKLLIS